MVHLHRREALVECVEGATHRQHICFEPHDRLARVVLSLLTSVDVLLDIVEAYLERRDIRRALGHVAGQTVLLLSRRLRALEVVEAMRDHLERPTQLHLQVACATLGALDVLGQVAPQRGFGL